jgi:ribosomal protein S18 acetylase RimI-like enzyme
LDIATGQNETILHQDLSTRIALLNEYPDTERHYECPEKSSVTLTLRQPHVSDYDALASWITDATACLRWAGPRVPFPFSAVELPELLRVPGGESYFLAEGHDAPHAFGQHWVDQPGAVHLGRIIVSPTRRGAGVGRLLCTQLMAEALRSTGASSVTLRVYRDNRTAVALYSSLGFSPVEAKSDPQVLFMSVRRPAHIER